MSILHAEKMLKTLSSFVLVFLVLILSRDVTASNITTDGDNSQEPSMAFVVNVAVVVCLSLRFVFLKMHIPVPYPAFIILFGLFAGLLSTQFPKFFGDFTVFQRNIVVFLYFYMPAIIFKVGFCIDMKNFKKAFGQIFVIAAPVFVVTSAIIGFVMRSVMNVNWTSPVAILFGVLCAPVYSMDVVKHLNSLGTYTMPITILMEGEAMFSLATGILMSLLIEAQALKVVVHWYQFVSLTLRFIILETIWGYVIGYIFCYLMRTFCHDNVSLLVFTVTTPFIIFNIVSTYGGTTGVVTIIILALMMANERKYLPADTNKILTHVWEVVVLICTTVMSLTAGIMTAIQTLPNMKWIDIMYIFMTFFMTNVARFLAFALFLPILSRLGYGFTFTRIIIFVWSGIKSRVSLGIVVMFFDVFTSRLGFTKTFVMHTVVLYWLTLFINGTTTPILCKFLKLSDASLSRQVNMNNCLMYIYTVKQRALNVLKMNRFMSDLNWSVVNKLTMLKHPYEQIFNFARDANNFFLDYDIEKFPGVTGPPIAKKKYELERDDCVKVMNAKKFYYTQQFKDGIISKEVYKILNEMDNTARDASEVFAELDATYQMYLNEGWVKKVLRYIESKLNTEDLRIRPPQNYFRRKCYHFVFSKVYHVVKYITISLHIVLLVFNEIYMQNKLGVVFTTLNILFYICDIAEITVKILAYSRRSITKDGMRLYVRSFWNIILLIAFVIFTLYYFPYLTKVIMHIRNEQYLNVLIFFLLSAKVTRFLEIFSYFEFINSKLMRNYLNSKIDGNRMITFEMGIVLMLAEREILEALPRLVQDPDVRQAITLKMEQDIYLVKEHVVRIRADKPSIAATCKTKLIIRQILNKMLNAVNDLKLSGWVDDVEHYSLVKSLTEQYQTLSVMRPVQPPIDKIVFREIPWIGKYPASDFLLERAVIKSLDTGFVICKTGRPIDGTYIIISGICHMEYYPNKDLLRKVKEYGCLPVMDYINTDNFKEPIIDYILPGSSFGEFSTISNRQYDCTITTTSPCTCYFISRSVIKRATLRDEDSITGLQSRIWKHISFGLAVHILNNVLQWRSKTMEDKLICINRAFVPNVRKFTSFNVNDNIEDILLIQGKVTDGQTNTVYKGPCYVPRSVREMLLTEGVQMHNRKVIKIRLLVIPVMEATEYECMNPEKPITVKTLPSHAAHCMEKLQMARTKHWE